MTSIPRFRGFFFIPVNGYFINMETLPKSFFDLIESNTKPVFVEFGAEWCGPCRSMIPVLEKLSKDFAGRLLVVKLDIDRKPRIAAYYNVRSVPTLMVFLQGKPLWRQEGALPYATLNTQIKKVLG